jgi:hypothetical protein
MGAEGILSGFWGSYGVVNFGCDSPQVLIQSLFDFVAQNFANNLTGVFVTGDYSAHDLWQSNVTEKMSETSTVFEMMRSSLKNGKSIGSLSII